MYIVGHYVITALSGCDAFDVGDDRSVSVMLPDYLTCHDWGYERCFEAVPDSVEGRLIRAHLLGDWFIHYGSGRERQRSGWAYQKMAIFAREYDSFFAHASDRDLRDAGQPPDSRRGFSHTMVEYSIDTWLALNGHFSDQFAAVQRSLGSLGNRDVGVGSWQWIEQVASAEGVRSSSPAWADHVKSFASRVLTSTGPQDLAYRAGVKKFGLADRPESIALVADTINRGLSKFPSSEMQSAIEQTAAFVSHHLKSRVSTWT
jgi:hypothetical protein